MGKIKSIMYQCLASSFWWPCFWKLATKAFFVTFCVYVYGCIHNSVLFSAVHDPVLLPKFLLNTGPHPQGVENITVPEWNVDTWSSTTQLLYHCWCVYTIISHLIAQSEGGCPGHVTRCRIFKVYTRSIYTTQLILLAQSLKGVTGYQNRDLTLC